MLCDSSGALCGAGRAPGMRETEARFLTDRRSAGRTTGVGRLRSAGFFLVAVFFLATLSALFRLAGRLPLTIAFFDLPLPLAMIRFPLAVRCGGTVYLSERDGRVVSTDRGETMN